MCNILGSDVIKSHQMVLLEMVLLILFKLTYLRPVPSWRNFMAKSDTFIDSLSCGEADA